MVPIMFICVICSNYFLIVLASIGSLFAKFDLDFLVLTQKIIILLILEYCCSYGMGICVNFCVFCLPIIMHYVI